MNIILIGVGEDKYSYQSLCSSCKKTCCETVDAPPVFDADLENLAKIGKAGDEFVQINKLNGKSMKSIKKKPHSNECIFLDSNTKLCTIYNARPFDCKIYPFDIRVISGEFYWIVYTCNRDSKWEWAEGYLQKFENDPSFAQFMKNVEIYDEYVNLGLDDRTHLETVLRRVNWEKE